jgi:serine/threonine-protein kinase RsbW
MALSLPRAATSVPQLRAALDNLLKRLHVTAQCRSELALLITEASSNAVRHGHGDQPIEVTIDVDDELCVLEIGNCDGQMDESRLQTGLPAPDQETGRGLPLIGSLADAVRILRPRPGWVVLHIAKRLEREQPPRKES